MANKKLTDVSLSDNGSQLSKGKSTEQLSDCKTSAIAQDLQAEENTCNNDLDNGVITNEVVSSKSDGNKELLINEENSADTDKPLPSYPTTLDDIDDPIEITYEERVARALANNPQQPCKRNSAKDDKISKYSTYGCIPFFIAAIIVTLVDKAKYRSPWSFLLLACASAVLCVGAFLRVANNKKCPCSLCETQGKNLRSSAIIWACVTVGALIAAVVFFIL